MIEKEIKYRTAQELRREIFFQDEKIAKEYQRCQEEIQKAAKEGYVSVSVTSLEEGCVHLPRNTKIYEILTIQSAVINLLREDGFIAEIVEVRDFRPEKPIETKYNIYWDKRAPGELNWSLEKITQNINILVNELIKLGADEKIIDQLPPIRRYD